MSNTDLHGRDRVSPNGERWSFLLGALAAPVLAAAVWWHRARTRRALSALTPDRLRDIGVDGGGRAKPIIEVDATRMIDLMAMR